MSQKFRNITFKLSINREGNPPLGLVTLSTLGSRRCFRLLDGQHRASNGVALGKCDWRGVLAIRPFISGLDGKIAALTEIEEFGASRHSDANVFAGRNCQFSI